MAFLVCADTERRWHSSFVDGYDSGEMDATHMMLEAENLGSGSVWVLQFDPAKVREAFRLPDHIKPVCLLPVGYPAPNAGPYRPWHDVFREIDDIAEELQLLK